MKEERFTLTQQHIDLLTNAYVDWCDTETGAPAIDPKRPYGNSFVEKDVAEIIGISWPDEDVLGPTEYDRQSDALYAKCSALHRETETALQIILKCKTFEPGEFRKDYYSNDWERVR